MSKRSAEATAAFATDSPDRTRSLGAALGRLLAGDEVIHLRGGLGAGKTCFVQGLAEGLGAEGAAVSPTFTLVNLYPGRVRLAHVDLYRLGSPVEIERIGLEELLGAGVTAVEWADRLPPHLGDHDILVHLTRPRAGVRRVEITARSTSAPVVRALKKRVPALCAGT
jgi:tRNA threonylcarbamoyladenosine biosynthesis protein TsaE